MKFAIQIGNISSKIPTADYFSVGDAIELSTELHQEHLIIYWNHVAIPVSYKYDLSVIVDDILELIEFLLDENATEKTLQWASNTFRASWVLRKDKDQLTIDSNWESISGNIEPLLNERSTLEISLADFLAEWKEVLKVSYSLVEDCSGDAEFEATKSQILNYINNIPGEGLLYR